MTAPPNAPAKKAAAKTTRLTPKGEVLRELYLLSGNNCAMPDCNAVIIDHAGVVVGHVCHIEAAMPDGARFNNAQSDEDRRSIGNLVLLCPGHHAQIDSKKTVADWTVAKLKKIKANHERKFKGLEGSLTKAFNSAYVDSTDSSAPTFPNSFARLERLLPENECSGPAARSRSKEIRAFVDNLSKIPMDVRDFMAGLIRRAIKLDSSEGRICVHVDDVKGVFQIGDAKVKKMGAALARYSVGAVDTELSQDDEPYISLNEPSDYVSWSDIVEFCEKAEFDLDDFVLRLKFGLLDEKH